MIDNLTAIEARLSALEKVLETKFAAAEQLATVRHKTIISRLDMERRLALVEEAQKSRGF